MTPRVRQRTRDESIPATSCGQREPDVMVKVADKGKGIQIDQCQIKGKGKAIANDASRVEVNVGSLSMGNPMVGASEVRIMPMLNSRDAPPYFDDPLGEGKQVQPTEITRNCRR